MNVRRIDKLITALETKPAKKMFNMGNWILRVVIEGSKKSKPISQAIKGEGTCGTSGCMLGMAAAIAPRYFKVTWDQDDPDDNEEDFNGEILYDICCRHDEDIVSENAFAEWLDIPYEEAVAFCNPGSEWWMGHGYTDVKHAIKLLKTYRDKGSVALPHLNW